MRWPRLYDQPICGSDQWWAGKVYRELWHVHEHALPARTAPPSNPMTISKSVNPTNLPTGGVATYTVVVNNPSSFATKIDRITDVLPGGFTFNAISAGSQVTAANS